MLVYRRKLILVMDYKKYEGSIIERSLKIMEKVSQLKEATRRQYESHKLS